VTWPGGHRPAIDDRGVYPRPVQDPLPIWIAVGGNPPSAVRAGSLGLPMALAIIGGRPEQFVPFADLHRRATREAGHDPAPPLSINSHGFVAETREEAIEISYPAVSATMNRIGAERGWRPMAPQDYAAAATLRGANFVGSPNRFGLPAFYELHVWAFRNNTKGTYVDFNPAVSCDGFEAAQAHHVHGQ